MCKRRIPAIRVCHFIFLALFALAPLSAIAQKPATATPSTAENRTAHALELARTDPLNLYAFLKRMPKGADLHNHLGGAVYAESWIRAGAEDNLCVELATHTFFKSRAMTDNQLFRRTPSAATEISRRLRRSRISTSTTRWLTLSPCAVSCRPLE